MSLRTAEELKEAIRELIPGADFDTDEGTGEIIVYTNLAEDDNGELEELDPDDFDEDMDDFEGDNEEELDDNDLLDAEEN